MKIGGQEHFYMETQCCIAIPKGEFGEMEVISSTQDVAHTQVCGVYTLTLYIMPYFQCYSIMEAVSVPHMINTSMRFLGNTPFLYGTVTQIATCHTHFVC